jgi:hypothetical protein
MEGKSTFLDAGPSKGILSLSPREDEASGDAYGLQNRISREFLEKM